MTVAVTTQDIPAIELEPALNLPERFLKLRLKFPAARSRVLSDLRQAQTPLSEEDYCNVASVMLATKDSELQDVCFRLLEDGGDASVTGRQMLIAQYRRLNEYGRLLALRSCEGTDNLSLQFFLTKMIEDPKRFVGNKIGEGWDLPVRAGCTLATCKFDEHHLVERRLLGVLKQRNSSNILSSDCAEGASTALSKSTDPAVLIEFAACLSHLVTGFDYDSFFGKGYYFTSEESRILQDALEVFKNLGESGESCAVAENVLLHGLTSKEGAKFAATALGYCKHGTAYEEAKRIITLERPDLIPYFKLKRSPFKE